MTTQRADYEVIVSQVRAHARVLDVGCGDGALLERLIAEKRVKGRGMELSQAGVNACVAKGLAVVQGDADRDLQFFPDASFDYVILSKTIQAVHRPGAVLQELARIGDRVIVSLPNFGHWKTRVALMVSGRMPVNPSLPASWHETENIHLCTVRDFAGLAADLGLMVERAFPISGGHAGAPFAQTLWRANWFAEDVVFVLRAREAPSRAKGEVVRLRA
jgi:methionine biosynthesis protein MetW